MRGGQSPVEATVNAEAPDGVILAHGGDKEGYSVYLKEGRVHVATCVDWKRTIIAAEEPIGNEARAIEFFWQDRGGMLLKVDGELVARGEAPGPLFNPVRQNGEIPIKRLGGESITYILKRRQEQADLSIDEVATPFLRFDRDPVSPDPDRQAALRPVLAEYRQQIAELRSSSASS